MAYIKVNQDKVNKKTAETLIGLCPFNAFEYKDGKLSITSACRVCKICVKNGPEGVCEFVEEAKANLDRSAHKGITVYVEQRHNHPHPVTWELIGKAKELAEISDEPVYALIIGEDVDSIAEEALSYGVDKAFVYENDAYHDFNVERYVNVIETFNETYHPNTILFGGTSEGRSFAPRVAARLKTGLTADCTKLDIRPNGDLLQIRPAFGGNIMAKIHTPAHRPQLATIRHKIFDAPKKTDPFGEIIREDCSDIDTSTRIELLKSTNKPKVKDISEAEIIVAVGRAFKKEKDLQLIKPLVERLHAEVACTRPLIENGWFDPRRQIGLSGRTVKPKLIVNLGISGAIQFIEGMKDSELIVSVNSDADNALFSISHYAIEGDIYEILPELNKRLDSIIINDEDITF